MTAARLSPSIIAGVLALAAIALLIGGAFVGLLVEGIRDGGSALLAFDGYLARVALFTLWQAALSTVLSIAGALLVARALSRHPNFFDRAVLLRLFALPLALPAIVAALGLLALYGRAGFLSGPLSAISGGPWPGIYGLSGILVAHVFFNMPLAARLLLEALDTIGTDQWRLASQLGMGTGASFRFIEWPVLRASLPGVAGLVFMLCVTSFTLVLTLGGGPAATTLEVAIYQALRFDFDPARAVALTLLQIVITAIIVAALFRLGANTTGDANLSVAPRRPAEASVTETTLNVLLLATAVLFVVGPIIAILLSGLQADLVRLASDPTVHRATLTSLILGLAAGAAAVCLSLALISARRSLAQRHRSGRVSMLETAFDSGSGFVLVVPPVVIGAGWFLALRNVVDPYAAAPLMVVSVNAVMAMPFAMRVLRPAFDAAAERHDRPCAALGISGWNRIRLIDGPVLRRSVITAGAFAMALSLGDLGVVALFGSESIQTLPYLLLSRMGSYRTQDAAGIALLLGALCLALLWMSDRLGSEKMR